MLHITYKYCPQNEALTQYMADVCEPLTRYIRNFITGSPFSGVQQSHTPLLRPCTYVPAISEHATLAQPSTVSSHTIDLIIEIDDGGVTEKLLAHTLRQRICNEFPELNHHTLYIRRISHSADHALHHYCCQYRQPVT